MDNRPATDTRSLALDHVEAVKAHNELIEAELERPKPDHRRVSSLNAKLGIALKLAEVYANLDVAEAIREGNRAPRLLAGGGVDYSGLRTYAELAEEVPC